MPPRPADVVPSARRPDTVNAALADLDNLSARLTTATAAVEAAESALRDAERHDRENAARALREGKATIAAEPAGVTKARQRVAGAKRELDILRLAHTASEADLEQALDAASAAWTSDLDDEEQVARRHARELLAEHEQTCAAANAAASARLWLGDGHSLDRPPRRVAGGSIAPSSSRAAANGNAFDAATIWTWVAELVDPPPPAPRAVPRVAEPAA
jgi:hypothetical protein